MQLRGMIFWATLAWVLGTGATLLAPDEVSWLDNYADAMREAKRTQKPILLEFRCEA